MPLQRLRAAAVVLIAAAAVPLHAQQGDGTDQPVSGHVFKPAKVAPTPARVAQLALPPGFEATVFAEGLGHPRILVVAPDGTVYASRRDEGDVVMMKDADGDGRADGLPQVVLSRPGVHGLALHGGKLYLATVRELYVADLAPDGRPLTPRLLAGDLPDGGQHPNRTLAFGPDGMLYLSVGSSCNACNETNPEHAALLRISPDGQRRTVFARGLRNTIGFDWHPVSGELWGMDHGIDYLGDDRQPEELNHLRQGRQYGWPHVFGDGRGENPQSTPPGGLSKDDWRRASEPMVLGYTAHAAPMQMLFYTGDAFPAEFRGDAFVAMRGSWNRKPASGYELLRVRFAPDGRPLRFEPFVRGFLSGDGATHFARPVGLAMARDGALLLGDDGNGVIYRIAWRGAPPAANRPAAVPAGASAPAAPMRAQRREGDDLPLAMQRPQTALQAARANAPDEAALAPRAGSFASDAPMPPRHSAYHEGVSPALAWDPAPAAVSYVLLVEDPDAAEPKPFVHWLAWNVPATVTHLPEGLHTLPRLLQPDGMMQGRNSRGSVGWTGPRPPVGDAPHRYHFQLFALDTTLSLPVGADREAVLAAMRGHVIGRGVLVGRYAQAQPPLK